MKRIIKYIVNKTYKPVLAKYLSRTRVYRNNGIALVIPPQVFHPGFFSSTQLLLKSIKGLSLQGARLLELGAGSGLISMIAARKGAFVTATDINPIAIEFLQKNSLQNNISLQIIHSDLFANIPSQAFDIVAINPPYFKKKPETFAQHAWYCGENGEYFKNLFHELRSYIHSRTQVLMVLSEVCDIELIGTIAAGQGFDLVRQTTQRTAWEDFYVYAATATS